MSRATPFPRKPKAAKKPPGLRDPLPCRAKLQPLLDSLVGKVCLYRDTHLVFAVEMAEPECTPDEVIFCFKPLAVAGLTPPEQLDFEVGATWCAMTHERNTLWAHYVRWILVFDPDVVAKVLAEAPTRPVSLWSAVDLLDDHLHKRVVA
jgi:hypothetical protein